MDRTYVQENTTQRERLRALAARLTDDDLARELPGGWTVADTLGHLAFYDRRAAVLLERFAADGVFASPYDFDTLNEILPHLTRRIPPQAVLEEAIAAAEAADRAAAAISPSLIPEIARRNEVKLSRADHRRAHLDDVEAALERGWRDDRVTG